MRTNIDLDDDLLAKAAKILGTTTKRSTVEAALSDLIRRDAMHKLSELRMDLLDIGEVRPGWSPSARWTKATA